MRRVTAVIAMFVMICAAAIAAEAGSAGAAARPGATLAPVATKITANTSPHFRYGGVNLPRTAKLFLQRQFGSARVWRTVVNLVGHSGTVVAPKVPLGAYYYRNVASNNGRLIAVSGTKTIFSYGRVPLARICAVYNGYTCDSGTTEVGSTIFAYAWNEYTDSYPGYYSFASYTRTSCRSLNVQFINAQQGYGERTYLKLQQAYSDPVVRSVGDGAISTLSAYLDGGPFYVDASNTDGDDIQLAGSLSCYTAYGRR